MYNICSCFNSFSNYLKTKEVVSDGEKVYPTDFQFRTGNRIYFDINP